MKEIYDIFISYRRSGGGETAKNLYHWLAETEGYSTFYDKQSLREGRWEENLLKHLAQCKDFILIVDSNTFTKTINSEYPQGEDWVRTEVVQILKRVKDNKENVGIIPIILPNATFPEKRLPRDIKRLNDYNAIFIDKVQDFFDDEHRKNLLTFLNSKPTRVLKEQYINPTPIDNESIINMVSQKINQGVHTIMEMDGQKLKVTFNNPQSI